MLMNLINAQLNNVYVLSLYYNENRGHRISKVEHLTLHPHFNSYIDNLPISIKTLQLGEQFNMEINNLPDKMTTLICGDNFNQYINNIPNSIENLIMNFNYNNKISLLPINLKLLMLNSNYMFDAMILPLKINKIVFITEKTHNIDIHKFLTKNRKNNKISYDIQFDDIIYTSLYEKLKYKYLFSRNKLYITLIINTKSIEKKKEYYNNILNEFIQNNTIQLLNLELITDKPKIFSINQIDKYINYNSKQSDNLIIYTNNNLKIINRLSTIDKMISIFNQYQ